MYCNKENINILTSLLVAHGVRHAVVCPGSRNAPIVHNLNEHPDIRCHAVTDERSAGFIALGLAQQSGDGLVCVCVTSGSALLNVLPAVAEATYQRCGIIVISADRPQAWIDQLDGQTLPQPGALGGFVAKCVDLPEPSDDVQRWHCNRLVNEAVIALRRTRRCVHINVPISEPLFQFTVERLPDERMVRLCNSNANWNSLNHLVARSHRMLVVMGQGACLDSREFGILSRKTVVLHEPLSAANMPASFTDEVMARLLTADDPVCRPDLIVYMGGHTVSKRMRQYLRRVATACPVVMHDDEGELHDVTMHATHLYHCTQHEFVGYLCCEVEKNHTADCPYIEAWENLRADVAAQRKAVALGFSADMAVRLFEEQYAKDNVVYYANSMSVRLGCKYADGSFRYCNRGVNGIEGSLSTAVGAALALQSVGDERKVFCVIGDLSFFYDENALWQQSLDGTLRILLINNGGGAIFHSLPGLDASPACDEYVSASHDVSAWGICHQFNIDYRMASDETTLREALDWLANTQSVRPCLVEMFLSEE